MLGRTNTYSSVAAARSGSSTLLFNFSRHISPVSTTVNNSQTDLGHLHLYLKIEEWPVMLLGYYFSHCIVLLLVFKNFPWFLKDLSSVQFSSVTQSCLTLCDPMNCSTPSLPVHHQVPEFSQTHVIESVMPSNHLILCHPLLLLPSIFPSIRDLVYF